jgi:adenylylsulfate kinase
MRKEYSNLVVWHQSQVTRSCRETLNGHKSVILWFTGLSGAGKSTLAHAVEKQLHERKCHTFVLDGDNIRHGLSSDLGFDESDRKENMRRIAQVAKLMLEAGHITLTAFISPFKLERNLARQIVAKEDFIEIYCKCDIDICEQRDVKGFYQKARLGQLPNFTGISSPYEVPENPELVLDTAQWGIHECVKRVLDCLKEKSIIQ